MPSRKGMEQALTWLKSKMAEKDTLDAINAEVCYNVITDLQKKKKVIGALYSIERSQNRRRQMRDLYEKDEDIVKAERRQELYEAAVRMLHGYPQPQAVYDVDIPEEWKETDADGE